MTRPVIKLSEVFSSDSEDFELPLLGVKLLNKEFTITAIEIKRTTMGEYALVTTSQGDYRTSSEVIIEQLKQLKIEMTVRNVDFSVKLTEKQSESGWKYQILV